MEATIDLNQGGSFERYLRFGILLSLILHLGLVLFAAKTTAPTPIRPLEIDVVFESSPPQIQTRSNQIVTIPQEHSEMEAPKSAARFLSDKDSNVQEEKVLRGDSLEAGATVGRDKPSSKAPLQKGAAKANLKLDQSTLLEKFGELHSSTKGEQAEIKNEVSAKEMSYSPFSRASGSGAALLGEYGSNDYLPHLPDGDITLLNAKANKFAVFVRRVATRVFAALRQAGWEGLSASEVAAINNFSTVRAVISENGELLRVELMESSGSKRFDDVLVKAVNSAAADRNPPKDALLSDGTIHFIFASRSWGRGGVGRHGAPIERRWLLLGTGLE